MKRGERAAQLSAWNRREFAAAGLSLPCPWQYAPAGPVSHRPGRLLALFLGDVAVIDYPVVEQEPVGVRLIRGGIPWELWCPILLRAYRDGGPVPVPFRPARRLPPEWLNRAESWLASDQKAFLEKLREAGILPALRRADVEAASPWLPPGALRARFMDFTTR